MLAISKAFMFAMPSPGETIIILAIGLALFWPTIKRWWDGQ